MANPPSIESITPYVDARKYAWRHYKTGSIVRNIKEGMTYCLNKTAGSIWNMIREGITPERIMAEYTRDYGVPKERIHNDVANLIVNLSRLGLVDSGSMVLLDSKNNDDPILNIEQKHDMDQMLYEKLKLRDYLPFKATIELNNSCNLRCIHCINEGNYTSSTIQSRETINDILLQLIELGTFSLYLSGGEPLNRSDFLDICSLARSLGFSVEFITNGTLLNRDVIETLSSIHVERVSVSIHAITPSIYDTFVGVSGMYDNVIQSIENLNASGIRTKIMSSITKDNYCELTKIIDFCNRNSLDLELGTVICPTYVGNKTVCNLMLDGVELENTLQYKYGSINHSVCTHVCDAGRSRVYISLNGDVYPCVMYPEASGNVFQEELSDIWFNSSVLKKVRQITETDFKKCIDCQVKNYCHDFCIGTNYMHSGNPLEVPEYVCEHARLTQKITR